MIERSKLKVTIIDYKMSNLFSVKNACAYLGINATISSDIKVINKSDALILPGVGAFKHAIRNLNKLDLISPIKESIENGKPFLGVCLGLQLLFSRSEEFGTNNGLNIIDGEVRKFKFKKFDGKRIKVPHMGWNKVCSHNRNMWKTSAFHNLSEDEFYYFIHSYYVVPSDSDIILSNTNYHDQKFCSSIKQGNILATQFHPEKSGKVGIKIYSNWFDKILEEKENN